MIRLWPLQSKHADWESTNSLPANNSSSTSTTKANPTSHKKICATSLLTNTVGNPKTSSSSDSRLPSEATALPASALATTASSTSLNTNPTTDSAEPQSSPRETPNVNQKKNLNAKSKNQEELRSVKFWLLAKSKPKTTSKRLKKSILKSWSYDCLNF